MEFKLLKNRNFALMLFGESSSIFGDILLNMGLALYVLKITGSSEKFAFVLSIGILPKIFLGVFAGAIVDRLDKRKMMVILDLIRGVFLIGLYLFSVKYQLTMPYIYATVIVFSICGIFFSPCAIAMLPSILKKDELVSGNAMINLFNETLTVVALMFSAWFYGLVGIGLLMLIDGITFLISAFSEMLIEFKSERNESQEVTILLDIRDGFKMFGSDRRLISLVVNGSLTHMFLFPFLVVGIPHLLINVLGCPDVFYGVIESSSTIALILSSVAVSIYRTKPSNAKGINIGIFGMFVAVLAFLPLMHPEFVVLLTTYPLVALGYFSLANFIMYLAFGYYVVFFVSFYQSAVSRSFMGRFGSTMSLCFSVGRVIGYSLFGFLFNLQHFSYAVIVLAIGMLLKIVVHVPFLKADKRMAVSMSTETIG